MRFSFHSVVLTTLLATVHPLSATTLIPSNNSLLYYQAGGGQDVPLPAFYSRASIPINVNSKVGLGFNCGAFNPTVAFSNSLNNMISH